MWLGNSTFLPSVFSVPLGDLRLRCISTIFPHLRTKYSILLWETNLNQTGEGLCCRSKILIKEQSLIRPL